MESFASDIGYSSHSMLCNARWHRLNRINVLECFGAVGGGSPMSAPEKRPSAGKKLAIRITKEGDACLGRSCSKSFSKVNALVA